MSYNNKVHSHGNVPFSWEKKPGVSKETTQSRTKFLDTEHLDHDHHDYDDDQGFVLKLPPTPPPCPRAGARVSSPVPPPPGGGAASDQQPLLRRSSSSSSSSMRGLRKQSGDHEDPFLAAFKVCTKSSSVKRSGKSTHGNIRSDFMSGLKSFFAAAPCKGPESCAVQDGNLVRVSHQLHYKSTTMENKEYR